MARAYPAQALTTDRRRIKAPLLLVIALMASIARQPASAATEGQAPTLQPYTAQYQTTARGFDLSVTRKLETSDNGDYILTNGGKMLVVGFHEISLFRINDGEILPISYIFQGTGLVKRRRELQFPPQPGKISSLYKDKWYDLPYTEATLDRMNQMEQLRLELLKDPEAVLDVTLRVADGKRVKDSRLVLIAREMLSTPLGPVETLHYERLHDDADRKSDIWFAPQWDYLMVKTVHIEDGDPVEMILTSDTLGGQPVIAAN